MSFSSFPSALPYFDELHDNELLNELIKGLEREDNNVNVTGATSEGEKEAHPFMKAFHQMTNLTLTENGALTNASTQDAILDLSYGIQAVQPSGLDTMLKSAWEKDPLTTMHIIFYTRSIHRGKSLKEPFFQAYCWLLLNHPRTALANLHVLIDGTVRTDSKLQRKRRKDKKQRQAEEEGWDVMDDSGVDKEDESVETLLPRRDFKTHGYWKDLCTLLTIYCQDELEGPPKENEYQYRALHWPRMVRNKSNHRAKQQKKMANAGAPKDIEKIKEANAEHNRVQKERAREIRLEQRALRNKRVCELLEKDKTYRALHFTIAKLFSDQLRQDMVQMEMNREAMAEDKSNRKNSYALSENLSLAGKWSPSLCASHDKHTFLATTIAENLFPPKKYQEKDETRQHYLNKVRDLYRKEYLIPLRSALDLAEHHMGPGKWDTVDIRHLSAVCLQQNIRLFFKHTPDKVIKYMEKVSMGKKKVSGATLGPHELVYRARTDGIDEKMSKSLKKIPEAIEKYKEVQKMLLNGQWNTLVESIRDTALIDTSSTTDQAKKKIDLGECLAICDVSGSMIWSGASDSDPAKFPINAAIGLSLVVSNLAKPPFNGALITFTDTPRLFEVDTRAPFTEQVDEILQSPMGFNTNLCKIFTDVLLPMAMKHNLAPEDMVKRLFIFTDMEFDEVDNGMNSFITTQEFIHKQYHDAGYEVPELVWWNLCSNKKYTSVKRMNTPVTKDDTGVSLLSGFSAAMLKTFLDGDVCDVKDEKEEATVDGVKDSKQKAKKETPLDFVMRAVYHESFNGIVVVS
ncbi:MAG: hypothetical protein EXX96DRAFT_550677 [Benjaminiella poitrasii]|nr:MAG: hypothetical protein EXX96DRAFT_550677 [Benjaminiella poitrasii]